MRVDEKTKSQNGGPHEGREVTVQVNRQAVTLPRHRLTGLEIKRAAIEQGVQKRLKKPGDEHDLTDVGLVVLLFEALTISEAAAAHSNDGARKTRARVSGG